jgi:hypothetical protein
MQQSNFNLSFCQVGEIQRNFSTVPTRSQRTFSYICLLVISSIISMSLILKYLASDPYETSFFPVLYAFTKARLLRF